MERAAILAELRANPALDVLVIGGGINGIGTFRDLAAQGVRALLIDRADFAAGASSASSHMLHGGIRYLENGEFRLVREALTERNLMLKNAPHVSKPLPTTIPIFSVFSGFLNAPLKFLRLRDKPSERGAAVIKIGLIFYDIFARKYRVMPTHKMQGKQQSLAEYPAMSKDVLFTATYYDAWMPSPERICVELVGDAEALSSQAFALNYVSAVDAQTDSVTLHDEQTGESFAVRPKVVINAAGPWIDFVNRAMGKTTRFIGGTKGSHLIIDNPELYKAANGHEIFFENKDGRIVLILPYMGKVMIGTTDIRVDNPDDARMDEAEIDYIIGLVERVYPTIRVDRAQIVFHFCGVRPLPSSDSSYTGNVSRDHSIQTIEPSADLRFPIFSLIGGKWTTFRAFSELAADHALKRLGKERRVSTENMAIGGGAAYPSEGAARTTWLATVERETDIDPQHLVKLFERYGTRASEIAAYCTAHEDVLLRHLPPEDYYTRRELRFLIEREKVLHMDDLVLRRSLIAWLGQLNAESFAEIAEVCAEALGWSAAVKAAEMERAAAILARDHGVDLHPTPAPA